MRLTKYLTEGKNIDSEEILDLIATNCKPWLNLKADNGYFRAAKKSHLGYDAGIESPRKDRKPRDVHIILHRALDAGFKKRFGWNVRSEGLFVGMQSIAEDYVDTNDDLYMVFPIGNFKTVYCSDFKDILSGLEYTVNHLYRQDRVKSTSPSAAERDMNKEDAETIVNEFFDKYKFKTDLRGSTNAFTEVSLQCKNYYYINNDSIYADAAFKRFILPNR